MDEALPNSFVKQVGRNATAVANQYTAPYSTLNVGGFCFGLKETGAITITTPIGDGTLLDAQQVLQIMNFFYINREQIIDGAKVEQKLHETHHRKKKEKSATAS